MVNASADETTVNAAAADETTVNATADDRQAGKGVKRKVEIKQIEDESKREVTFSKRRAGLFKEAGELSALCGTKMAVVVESPAGNFFTFGHPNADLVIDRYLTEPHAETLEEEDIINYQVESMNRRRYSEVRQELDAEMKKKGAINDGDGSAAACDSSDRVFWWEEDEDEEFDDEEELEDYMFALQDLKNNLLSRADDLSLLSLTVNSANSKQDSCSAPVSSSKLVEVDDNSATVADEEEEEEEEEETCVGDDGGGGEW